MQPASNKNLGSKALETLHTCYCIVLLLEKAAWLVYPLPMHGYLRILAVLSSLANPIMCSFTAINLTHEYNYLMISGVLVFL
jgi:hypothetical protein